MSSVWTPQEKETLHQLTAERAPIVRMAARLKRTHKAVRCQQGRMGLA